MEGSPRRRPNRGHGHPTDVLGGFVIPVERGGIDIEREFATINKYEFAASSQYVDVTGGGKVFIYVSGQDVRMGLDQYSVENEPYFVILDGTTLILDYPLGIDAPIWFRPSDTGGSTVTLRTLVTANPSSAPTPVKMVD